MGMLSLGIEALERGLIPDPVTRSLIRRLCRQRLHHERARAARADPDVRRFLESLRSGPIAIATDAANRQHYELPPRFFAEVLGARRKYSCCYFPAAAATLDQAEEEALRRSCEMAELHDGQSVLELGCGWGALSLWMAEQYPHSRITAVSNSAAQREFIVAEARRRGLQHLEVVTCDINDLELPANRYDRVVSVEMFEHMRNYELLLSRIAACLRPSGKLYVHHFCHRTMCYAFETEGAANWMGRHFFTGGLMPSVDLLRQYEHILWVARQETWGGAHYQRTADAWLGNLDARRNQILPILAQTYGAADAERWFQRWRVFFLSVSELFGADHGREWLVSHAVLESPD